MRIYTPGDGDRQYLCGHWNGSRLEIGVARSPLEEVPPGEVLHYHDYAEYYIVLEGSAELEVDGAAVPLRAGSVVMVEAGERHRVTSVDPTTGARWVIVKERSEPDSKHVDTRRARTGAPMGDGEV